MLNEHELEQTIHSFIARKKAQYPWLSRRKNGIAWAVLKKFRLRLSPYAN